MVHLQVEKMKIGPPPECPCKDPKCPKKPVKEEEEEVVVKEDLGPCAMKSNTYNDTLNCRIEAMIDK